MSSDKNKKSIIDKLKYKYRLIIINEDTFEQKTSLRLSRINLYSLLSLIIVGVGVLIFSLIAFTPLKFVLPGVESYNERSKLFELSFKTDSIESITHQQTLYLENLHKIMNNDLDSSYYQRKDKKIDNTDLSLQDSLSLEDKELRDFIENEIAFSLTNSSENYNDSEYSSLSSLNFISPIEGIVTSFFSLSKEHYGIDIAGKEGQAVKAALAGSVIDASWNYKTGYVITVQHDNNLITIYKHNSELLKKTGNFVEQGEAIAISGNSGELSSGPHLHFELWSSGKPLDPEKFIFLERLKP